MELASCHPPGSQIFEVAAVFLKNVGIAEMLIVNCFMPHGKFMAKL